ncbi:MAG: outer membrane beta-barrel protein [Bacteroidetes bacterium]|nr:outer membrane beta-barrel protein [Bacteroidota bacterium]
MNRVFTTILVLLLGSGVAFAQEREGQSETRIVLEQEKPQKQNYYSVRFGLWFPEDEAKGFNFEGNLIDETEGKIDQSQAMGLDFHFRKNIGSPLYTDLSVGGWYTTYQFSIDEVTSNGLLREADAWALIVPITIGLSIAPLPDNPVQPYAMAGLGAYVAFTGRELLRMSDQNVNDTETFIRFGFYLGAGLDLMLAEAFGISVGAKYQFLEFDEPLFTGQKNFTGLQASIGVAMKI